MSRVVPVAFYLPQYHPIPENDEWWGKGFTEWTNVTKAKPLFKGHLQPFLPADLGYYDLRVSEVRIEQANLAREVGIKAFCYWHYWFGNGKRLLERPFNEIVETGQPEFPFCLAWANESWTGRWHGLNNKTLVEQIYPGKFDYKDHFLSLVNAFNDLRYFKINGRNLFILYRPDDIPNLSEFIETWRELAYKRNAPDFFFIGVDSKGRPSEGKVDGSIRNQPAFSTLVSHPYKLERFLHEKTSFDFLRLLRFGKFSGPKIYFYSDYVDDLYNEPLQKNEFPVILPNWDNTPRCAEKGVVLLGSTPELYGKLLQKGINSLSHPEIKLIFIKSWNEWAEGNTLEPSIYHKDNYLNITKKILKEYNV